jgi:bacteriorhodopsin
MNNTTDLGAWWASLALINAGLAQTKGRSRWYWFLFSLFLGPLATLFIVVWPPLSRTGTKKATDTSTSTRTAIATED